MKHVSLAVVNSLSRDVIFALAAFNSRFKSSFSIASFDKGTELFFCFLDGGLEAVARGTAVEGSGTRDGAGPMFDGAVREGTNKGGIEKETGGGKDVVGVTGNGAVDTCVVKDVGGVEKRGRRSGWSDMVGVLAGTAGGASSSSLSTSKQVILAAGLLIASVLVSVGRDKKEAVDEEGADKAGGAISSQEWDFQQVVLWKNFAHVVHRTGTALPLKILWHPPQLLLAGRSDTGFWLPSRVVAMVLRERIALLMLWMCLEQDIPRSLNIGSRTFSANHIGAIVESGIMKPPWIWISRVVWRRWIVRVPMEHAGVVAVLREIRMRRFSTRPVRSVVSMVEDVRVATMP